MSILDSLLSVIAPYRCLGCGHEGRLVCPPCRASQPAAASRCYRCLHPSFEGRTCASCLPHTPLTAVQVGFAYKGLVKQLVRMLKFNGAQSASREIADLLVSIELAPTALLVHAPTATGRVRSRGYDQARLLCRDLAHSRRMQTLNCLRRVGQTHQVGASRPQRQAQLTGAFRVINASKVVGRHIILVDDVMTTGATLESAATALLREGALRVDAVVFARA